MCKADVMKEDCPLWRVDNQNLLQKYPAFSVDGKIMYKNSSTVCLIRAYLTFDYNHCHFISISRSYITFVIKAVMLNRMSRSAMLELARMSSSDFKMLKCCSILDGAIR